jgi:hypothetical protein
MKPSLIILACFFMLFAGSNAKAKTSSIQVKGLGDLSCTAFLHTGKNNSSDLPLYVSQAGTGVYTNSNPDELDPTSRELLTNNLAAVLTIDKPGIVPDSSNKEGGVRVEQPYYRYTTDDLVSCVDKAIKWASQSSAVSIKRGITFSGHSEGAIVLVELYRDALKANANWVSHLKLVMLSGVPLEGMDSIIGTQFGKARLANFWKALETKDDKLMRELLNMGVPYWARAVTKPSLRKVLETLALQKPNADFAIFQGLEDGNTPHEPVIEFERWNDIRQKRDTERKGKSPPLKLSVRYYLAGHYLNQNAINDMVSLWRSSFQ